MKRKLLTILACAMACMTSFAQHTQAYFNIEADIELPGYEPFALLTEILTATGLPLIPMTTIAQIPVR